MKYSLIALAITGSAMADKSFEIGTFYESMDSPSIQYQITGVSFEAVTPSWKGFVVNMKTMAALTLDFTMIRNIQEMSYPLDFGPVSFSPSIGVFTETIAETDYFDSGTLLENHQTYIPVGFALGTNYMGVDLRVKYSHLEPVKSIFTIYHGCEFSGTMSQDKKLWNVESKIGYSL